LSITSNTRPVRRRARWPVASTSSGPKPAERLFGASEHGNVSAAMDKPTLLLDWGPAAEAGTSRPGL
jgi:hypothetical protein